MTTQRGIGMDTIWDRDDAEEARILAKAEEEAADIWAKADAEIDDIWAKADAEIDDIWAKADAEAIRANADYEPMEGINP